MITCKILADSINPKGVRITSWLLKYPRWIHSEVLTHRIFSRNAASSRAIPFQKMLMAVSTQPALPEFWAAEHKGMKALEALPDNVVSEEHERGDGMMIRRGILHDWQALRDVAVQAADQMSRRGLAKSLCNRLVEPWAHMEAIFTATTHPNYFALRAHPDAMPEFQVLAFRMLDQYLRNQPKPLKWDEWHIPEFHGAPSIMAYAHWSDRLKIATARCARLSYLTFDGEHSPEKDLELYQKLLTPPVHASPFEHCAQAIDRITYKWSNFDQPQPRWDGYGNLQIDGLSHWLQYRKTIERENANDANLNEIMATKPDWINL